MKILSYNIQACIGSRHYSDYLLGIRNQVLHSPAKDRTLEKIADLISDFDVVCLQELDLGGRRSGFTSQFDALKQASGFAYGISQTTRVVPRISHHGNAIFSRYPIREVEQYELPGRFKGRGLLVCRIEDYSIANTHLSLNVRAQKLQMEMIGKILQGRGQLILMGDFNCRSSRPWLKAFCQQTGTEIITNEQTPTFPSWKPRVDIDHIFVAHSAQAEQPRVIDVKLSDHLPVMTNIK